MRLRTAIASACIAGTGIAAYLTYVHYAHVQPLCSTGGCEKVQTSSYATLAGVPVAAIGLVGYVILLGLAFVPGTTAGLLGASAGIGGAAFGGYLLWAQLARIHAICQWCLANDGVIAVVAALCVARVVLEPEQEDDLRRE